MSNPAPAPTLGIDLDGCVDEYPDFFRTLTGCWPGSVVVITYRSDREKTIADLARFGITYTHLVLVSSFDAKPAVIEEYGVDVYFDDQPEMLRGIPSSVAVMLVRNEGNHDFEERRWLFSPRTGRMV